MQLDDPREEPLKMGELAPAWLLVQINAERNLGNYPTDVPNEAW